MKKIFLLFPGLISVAFAQHDEYPHPRKDTVVTNYFGIKVPDPYRWMENTDSPEVKQWVQAENKVTGNYLAQIPYRDKIKGELEVLWNYPKVGAPFAEGGRVYFSKNSGLQNQAVVYTRANGKDEVMIDPNTMSDNGTASLNGIFPSYDGKYLAYGVSNSGSDWIDFYVKDMASGKLLTDHIQWTKFGGVAWYGNGFYYSGYDKPESGNAYEAKNTNNKIFYHQIGSDQAKDALIYSDPKQPDVSFGVQTEESGKYLFVSASNSTNGNQLWFSNLPLQSPIALTPINENWKTDNEIVDVVGGLFYMRTNEAAPNYRLVAISPMNPKDKSLWRDILPNGNNVLQNVVTSFRHIVAGYLVNASSALQVFSLDGKWISDIKLPTIGTAAALSGHMNDSLLYFSFVSFTYPSMGFVCNMKTMETHPFEKISLPFEPDDFQVLQLNYANQDDGTEIPMFVVMKKGTELNGMNPTLLYGYGGFNISMTPAFSASRMELLNYGGIFAMPCLRGGGEFGESWHEAGKKELKQNVFNDFYWAARYLIEAKYTNPDKLAINGRSNGGLLIGATITQHPELFKVAIPQVGVLDMLRYHTFTIGYFWADEYGRSDHEQDFKYLYQYSPLHNVQSGKSFPCTLITTGDHDDRVVPAHSFKFAATMQENAGGDRPILIRIDTQAGHGAGKPISKTIEEDTDIYSFIFWNLNVPME